MSSTSQNSPEAAWYALQVTPRTEVEVIRALDRMMKAHGAPLKTIPSSRRIGSVLKASAPYFGLILWNVALTDELRAEVEATPSVRGLVLEPETYLIEFDGESEEQHIDEAIAELHKMGRDDCLEAGFAPFVLSDAKKLGGERAFEFLNNFYLDSEGTPLPPSARFIEVKMRMSPYHRQLIREIPGVVDVVGGERPVVKRGQRLSTDAELKPALIRPEAALSFSRKSYQVYALQVLSKYENHVISALHHHRAQQELALFSGQVADLLINAGRVLSLDAQGRDSGECAFKGYVYTSMHMDADSWHLIRSTHRVVGFVGGQNLSKVRPMTGNELELLGFSRRKVIETVEAPIEVEAQFKSGDLVVITDGPFASFVGEVQEVNASTELLKLLINPNFNPNTPRQGRGRFVSDFNIPTDVEFKQVKLLDEE